VPSIIPFNTGIYTVPEASRLTCVASPRIRRWLKGYTFFSGEREHVSPPVWRGQLKPVDGALALGFLDLMEIRVVDAFLRAGVSWKTLREAERRGSKLFQTNHPFCTQRFETDGRAIFVDIGAEPDEPKLLEIINSQAVFDEITSPFFKDLEFSQDRVLERWWPLGDDRSVVVDPRRAFGKPIVVDRGVPTMILSSAAKASKSIDEVVFWYDVAKNSVIDAMEFEDSLSHAKAA
jgi:uncharacterized protein (DUF433 family)